MPQVHNENLTLGREAEYPQKYAPEVLCGIDRAGSRVPLGLRDPLPFTGRDTWNAWELTWLDRRGKPRVATAEIHVPAESPRLVESKSLKLYLGSFAMTGFDSENDVAATIARDLEVCTGVPVRISVLPVAGTEARSVARLAGTCLDELDVDCSDWDVNPDLLAADTATPVREDLHTHLLRSLCPVTAQPDVGSLLVSYKGPAIDRASLLRYVVSYRQHNDFHEACVERIFVDLLERCGCTELTVQARYQRRGGIDINPFRSNAQAVPRNLRLWRQ